MNTILKQTEIYMRECLGNELPDLKPKDLEKDGAIFYMNGKNGTAFDWFVNGHFPDFYIFYNDKENLGAAKAMLYSNSDLTIYIYGDKGHAEPVCFEKHIEATNEELLELAALMTENADEKKIWDEDIRILKTDTKPHKRSVKRFLSLKEAHMPMIEYKELIKKTAIVSKKVRIDGWKIGYGMREEPTRESDSGWYFCVGDETEEYVNNPDNLELWTVNSVLIYDPALSEFITAPYGTAIVRTASQKFELDAPGKDIFIVKK